MDKSEKDRILVEIQSMEQWSKDLVEYLESSLQDQSISQEEFVCGATMFMRVMVRLKLLHNKVS